MEFYIPASALPLLAKGKSTRVTCTAKPTGPSDVRVWADLPAAKAPALPPDHIDSAPQIDRLGRPIKR